LSSAALSGLHHFKAKRFSKKRGITKEYLQPLIAKETQGAKKKSTFTTLVKQRNNRNLTISLSALGLISSGYLFYTPLLAVGIAPLLYITFIRLKNAYYALFKEQCLHIEVVDGLWAAGAIATGYYFWVALGCSLYFVSEKV
jgi:hypothetical protein